MPRSSSSVEACLETVHPGVETVHPGGQAGMHVVEMRACTPPMRALTSTSCADNRPASRASSSR